MKNNQNILIVKHGALGDVIRTSYILPGLFNKYSYPNIYWFTAKVSFDLLRFNPYIYKIVTLSFNFEILKKINFDLVISLDDELDIVSNLQKIQYKTLIGANTDGNDVYYTNNSSEWFDMGLISRFGKEKADLLKKLNTREHNQILSSILDIDIDDGIFFNSPLIEEKMKSIFDRRFYNIGLNSGAGSRWLSKQLPIEETINLINCLLSMEIDGKPVCIFLLGGNEESERHSAIMESIKSSQLIDTGNNNTLLEFAAIIKQCDLLISSDSLALHLAISQKIKNISFFAPTSAAEIGTFGHGYKIISTSSDYCSYKKNADNTTLTASRLINGILTLLSSNK